MTKSEISKLKKSIEERIRYLDETNDDNNYEILKAVSLGIMALDKLSKIKGKK